MRYWKRIDKDGDDKFIYVESSDLDYLIDRLIELYDRRNELNEQYYHDMLGKYLERIKKEIGL